MKKMSNREMMMVMVLLIAIVGFGFIKYVWDPMQVNKQELISEMKKTEDELVGKNVTQLEQQKRELDTEQANAQMKIEQIKQEKTFGTVDYQALIEYLGKEADSLEVDVVQFKKLEPQNSNAYWELPYEITVQGNYQGIIRFVNSMYNLENYFFITGMDLREVARIPMTDKVYLGEEELKKDIEFDWASEFIDKLDKSIPSEIKNEKVEGSTDDFATEMGDFAEQMEDELLQDRDKNKINDKLQLNFMFHFVSLDEPKK